VLYYYCDYYWGRNNEKIKYVFWRGTMVDFGKKLGAVKIKKKVDPLEIYETLDRASDKGPLRPVQIEILKKWFNYHFEDQDIILKLHTGQGKTLIGLLMLQSRLNKGMGPAIYLCPNNYLVDQTCLQAESFGISYTVYNGEIPEEFINEKSILITNVQTLFNGLTKFGLGRKYIEASTILMDDAHACIDSIKDACKVVLKKGTPPFQQLLELFGPAIEKQGVGTFADIKRGEYESLLPIPYWEWHEKYSDVAQILSNNNELDEIKFPWQILKDNLRDCDCFVSGQSIEIIPYVTPLDIFGTYKNASQRIFMSATVSDDAFLIKGLGLNSNTIRNPLCIENEKWSGEKMILIPSLIDDSLNRSEIVSFFGKTSSNKKFGVVALTPSFKGTKDWEKYGSTVVNSSIINQELENLKNKNYEKTLVIANRYDGIDLPDFMCRLLVMDSSPYFDSLSDRYIESCRGNSDLISVKKAQKIEQGLGRSVRGEKDYSAIIITGPDLLKLVQSRRSRELFSDQTRAQIEIGLEIAEFAKEEIKSGSTPKNAFVGLINQLLKRDDGWKQFYVSKMDQVEKNKSKEKVLEIFQMEKKATDEYLLGNYNKAASTLQSLIDNHVTDPEEKGWYLQEMAKYLYPLSKTESNKLQVTAHKNNRYLMMPKEGIEFKKISTVSWKRVESIKKYMENYTSFEDFQIELNSILDSLRFGVRAEKFEEALNKLGKLLGFVTERPDKEWKEGPDNLWLLENNKYLMVECKNQVDTNRIEINKDEAGQMNNAIAWFKKQYGDVKVTRVLIIPAKTLNRAAGFNEEVKIIRNNNLKRLVADVKGFFNEFQTADFSSLSEAQIQRHLNTHNLLVENIVNNYVEEPKVY
jgi:replicative superfamily II helicase